MMTTSASNRHAVDGTQEAPNAMTGPIDSAGDLLPVRETPVTAQASTAVLRTDLSACSAAVDGVPAVAS